MKVPSMSSPTDYVRVCRVSDVPDPGNGNDFYITDFSSRQLPGQQLDVAAPGSWVVGPYQVNGQLSWYYLSGTSMASPHVAGVAALMLQKNSTLLPSDIENILKTTALALPPGCRSVINPDTGSAENVCWGANATGAGVIQADMALAAVQP